MNGTLLGDCRDEELVAELFGSVSEFARLIEENGDNFDHFNTTVHYDEEKDVHYFFDICGA